MTFIFFGSPNFPYLGAQAGHLVLELPHPVALGYGGGEVALSHQLLVLVLQVGDLLGELGHALRVLRLADPGHHQVLLQLSLQVSKPEQGAFVEGQNS